MNPAHLRIRPILYTDRAAEWLVILRALGLQVLSDDDGWTLVASGSGRIALHRLFDGVSEGGVGLGFEVSDLDAYVATVADGPAVRLVDADHGRAVEVTGRDGQTFFVDVADAVEMPLDAPTELLRHVALTQLWVTPDVEQAAADLEALGCRRLSHERNGRTVTLSADAGRLLVHVDDGQGVGTSLGIDVDDVAASHAALLAAGIDHDVIDETIGRTLKVPMPGLDRMLWVGQDDDDPVGAVPA